MRVFVLGGTGSVGTARAFALSAGPGREILMPRDLDGADARYKIEGEAMRTSLILATLLTAAPAFADQPNLNKKPMTVAGMCVKIGEESQGAYKFCHYNCPLGEYTIEVKPMQPCPVTVDH
jgi:hypothetical protein